MTTPTYDLINSTTLSSLTNTVTFTSIDQSYRDFVLMVSGNSTDTSFLLRFNNRSGGSDYAWAVMVGFNSSTSGDRNSGTSSIEVGIPQSTTLKTVSIFQVLDYSLTDKHKNVLSSEGFISGSQVQTRRRASRFKYTEAITRVDLIAIGNFNVGTTVQLYGIAG